MITTLPKVPLTKRQSSPADEQRQCRSVRIHDAHSRGSPQTRPSEHGRRLDCIAVFHMVVAATLSVSLHAAHADMLDEPDLKEGIILRCHYDMAEFGVEGVTRCIEADTAALGALSTYPNQARPIISRCAGQLRGNGWEMIKVCVDRDLAAETALAQYPPEHTGAIDACRTEVGKEGAAKVKACADQRIAAKPETKRQ